MSTPPAKKTFRSRVGTVMRRASSFTVPTRPTTPTPSHETPSRESSDAGSLKQIETAALAPPEGPAHVVPSPIAESPAREAASLAAEPVGPSPLAATVISDSPAASVRGSISKEPTTEPEPSREPEPSTEEGLQPPQINEIPPTPVGLTESGKGIITDEPEEIQDEASVKEASSQKNNEDIPETARDPDAPAFEPPPGISVQDGAGSYFDLPASQPIAPPPFGEPQDSNYTSSDVTPRPLAARDTNVEPAVPSNQSKASLSSKSAATQSRDPNLSANPWATRAGTVSAKPSQSSLASSAGGARADQGRYISPQLRYGNGDAPSYSTSKASSIRMPVEDPFADPRPSVLSPVEAPPEVIMMPQPTQSQPRGIPFEQQSQSDSTRDEMPVSHPVDMPMPAINEVIASRSVHNAPSGYSLGGYSRGPSELIEHDTDERRPLLSRPTTPRRERGSTSYLQPSASSRFVSGRTGDSPWPVSTPLLNTLGWIEYVLPDGSFYYVHPNMRVTTDIDLRSQMRLEAVTAYFDHKSGEEGVLPPDGWELWLRDTDTKQREFRPVRCWVDHKRRIASFTPPSTVEGAGIPGDDKLDMEYRYWTYLEAHPAHIPLPPNARAEAVDALTWSYTDRLLPSSRPVPPPFSQAECQELMGLLRSFNETPGEPAIQTVVHTRIVSRILLRIAHWRQTHFRPHKALPRDAAKHAPRRPEHRSRFRRALLDFFISVICLGIPYIFMGRSHAHRVDEESGLQNAGPMLVIGACACLIAAIILSASVTFISLPGIDSIARVAGFLAILCSAASLVSAVIALFRYKTDVERTMLPMGEGLIALSRRSIVMSLPLVFLSYSIVAFITAILTYSFNGVTLNNVGTITHNFDGYTKWTVVGTVGGLAGVLTATALFMRR